MSVISRERIAEMREQAAQLVSVNDRAEARALIDAYEAQRPRPASEPPLVRCRVLVLSVHRAAWEGCWYEPAAPRLPWRTDTSGDLHAVEVLAWLPLPPLPKGGEE